jgi:[NiFe] hydrogenase assembly HybE family chaperone
MTEPRQPDPSPRLESAFTRIWKTRMQGLPFLNPALRVEAVGFRSWQGEWLGALVTPWFVNLVLMPGEGEWTALAEGDERFVTLPAGRFRFICGRDEELGEYHACSLFSPAQAFEDHATARAGAAASLEALFDAGNDEKERAAGAAPPSAVSKRDFLRGCFSGSGDVPRG